MSISLLGLPCRFVFSSAAISVSALPCDEFPQLHSNFLGLELLLTPGTELVDVARQLDS